MPQAAAHHLLLKKSLLIVHFLVARTLQKQEEMRSIVRKLHHKKRRHAIAKEKAEARSFQRSDHSGLLNHHTLRVNLAQYLLKHLTKKDRKQMKMNQNHQSSNN